jgi:hypothetical protein
MSYQSKIRKDRWMNFLKIILGLSIGVIIIIYGERVLNAILDFLGL